MGKNIIMFAGAISILQAIIQIIFGSLSIAQYFCTVDFLRNNRELLLIKILYFTNTETCGNVIRIGNVFDGIANQAFIIFNKEVSLSTRTFIFSVVYTTLGCVWVLAAGMLLGGGARMSNSRSFRWTWVTATICVCVVDILASMMYANDSFHTQTLQDIAQHIGATLSGIRGVTVNTSATSWIMFAVSARLLVVLIMNIVLTVVVALQSYNQRQQDFHENDAAIESQPVQGESTVNSETCTKATGAQIPDRAVQAESAGEESVLPERPWQDIPRAYLSQAFRNMKEKIIKRTSGDSTGHTAAVLRGQLPWTYGVYTAASARQREVGSSDEDAPPMPLRDLRTFEGPCRKAFVHRASPRPRIQPGNKWYY